MSPTWFIIKSLFMTFAIVSVLQIKVGSEGKSLESHVVNWMKKLSASQRIQDVAKGGKELTTDIIKEFITADGKKIYIKQSRLEEIQNSDGNQAINTNFIKRLISSINLGSGDTEKLSIRDQIKKDVESEIRKEYEARLKKSGINPKTLDSSQN